MDRFIAKTANKAYNCKRGISWFLGVVFTAFLGFGLLEGTAEAQLMCSLEQITDETSGDSLRPSIDSDGTRIAFESRADINGGNPEGNLEIFLFDTDTMSTTQITDETSGDSFAPSIDSDGTRIAFSSRADINGGNPEGNLEIFLFDTNTMLFTQITDETSGGSLRPSINSDGTRIAFSSTADINGGNPEFLSSEIFLFDTNTMLFTQITDETSGGSFTPSINSDGTRIAFRSTADINGGNPEENNEIFLFDTDTMSTTQITDDTSGEASFTPSINSDGTRITFSSTADINGGNPDGNEEIFLFDTNTMLFTQITDETFANSFGDSINSDGTHIAFRSTADINGGNPEGNSEIFLFDTDTMSTTQITDETSGDGEIASINSDGTRIAFDNTADINGGNPDGNREIFVAVCGGGQEGGGGGCALGRSSKAEMTATSLAILLLPLLVIGLRIIRRNKQVWHRS